MNKQQQKTRPATRFLIFITLLLICPPVLADSPGDHAGWVSILPPLVAIGLALLLRQVIPALFLGVWVGAWAIAGFSLSGLGSGLLHTFEIHIRTALADPDHAAIILFSLMIGGMVGIISRNGGMMGVVESIVGFAHNVRRASAATVAMGLAIFFDDYANTLVVGNTMRPITDRLRISREKLAYLVDSTAAPIACIALVSTWIGYEVGLIQDALADIQEIDLNAYFVFLNSIPYSFYPLFALGLILMVVASGRDIGPMRAAERRARETGQVAPPTEATLGADADAEAIQAREGVPARAFNAVVPVVVMVATVIAGLFISGEGDNIREIIGSADPYQSLLWGSLLGVVTAVALTLGQRILSLEETVGAWFSGLRTMILAMIILVLAWALSDTTSVLGTAGFLTELLGDRIHPGLFPALVFILAAASAFATGSSWGTMGILIPLAVPTTWEVMTAHGMTGEEHLTILYATVAAVLGGAVWGDHCSPISDTTIMSSMASQCDHIEHVRTQLPYALLAGGVAIVFGALPAGFGVPWWLCLPAGVAVLILAMRFFGHPTPEARPPEEQAGKTG